MRPKGFSFWIAVVAMSLVAGCTRRGPNLDGVAATFVGTLAVEPKGSPTPLLYQGLMALARNHGMSPLGDGATGDGREWHMFIYCGKQFVGGATTASKGDLVLVNLAPYGFKDPDEYKLFIVEMVSELKKFGTITRQEETKPISAAELLERGKHTGFDVSSRCGAEKR